MLPWSSWRPRQRPLRDWLAGEGSLTRRLRESGADVQVLRLREGRSLPVPDEVASLRLARLRPVWVREVLLMAEGVPLVFAHSVTRPEALRGPWGALRGLGSRPLAEALFADPRIVRAPFLFRKLAARHPLYRRAAHELQRFAIAPPPELWARRSVFRRCGAPLMVTEVFLPAALARVPRP